MTAPTHRLVVRGRDWHSNIGVTRIEREECVVFAYLGNDLVGVFDLGDVTALYMSEKIGWRTELP